MTGLVNWAGAAAALRDWAPMLANHLWQSTAFAAIAAGLAVALKKNQARARYWIWMAASAKLLLPFALLAGIASHYVKPRTVAAPANAQMYVEVENFSEPFRMPVEAAPVKAKRARRAAAAAPANKTVTDVTSVTLQSRPAVESGAPGFVARVLPAIPLVCGVVWLAGFAAVLAVWGVRWRRVARAMRAAPVLREGREVSVLRRTEGAAGLTRPIEVRASAGPMEPGVFGILRPVLAWPAGISDRLDDAHLEAVMAHEVCHVRRRDNLTAAIHMFVEAVFWFHPLVWWVGARLVEERERACDEEVLLLCAEPQAYAESILKVCEFCVQAPLECVSGVTGADLKKRVVEIMTERVARKLTWGKKLLLVAAALVVAAVPLVLGQAQAARRMMLAAVAAAPKPVRAMALAASRAMIPEVQTPSTGLIAEMQALSSGSIPEARGATEIQSDARPFAFDVVSIRPSDPDPRLLKRRVGIQFTDDGFVSTNQSLLVTLLFQYQRELQRDAYRIVGGPDWARTLPWDIRAKVADSDIAEWSKLSHDSSEAAKERRGAAIKAMLADRFKLKTHFETREDTIYALVVAKGGLKIKPSDSDGPPRLEMKGAGHVSVQRATPGAMAPFCERELGHPVIDKTGITGKYDMTLDWMPTQGAAGTSGGDPGQASAPGGVSKPSLFTAVQEQLGLKLEAQKGPIETLVIDHVEKPSVDGAEATQPVGSDNTKASFVLVAQDATGAPAPPPQTIHFPQATTSWGGKKGGGPGIIDLPQPDFAAEITLAMHGATDWLQSVQVLNHETQTIVSLRIGWAYVLPTGALEFHQGDVQTVQGGGGAKMNFPLPAQNAAVRTDVKDFVAFVEQATLKDGTVVKADHDKIAATYKAIGEGKPLLKTRADVDPNSTAAQQAGTGPKLTPGLKPISFDVVSFRRTQREGPTRVDLPVEGDYIAYHGVPIDRLILFAHIARKGYVSLTGEPEWAKTDLYEFTAKVAPEDVAEWKQMTLTDKRAMVATLLADVLKLKVHQDTEPHPVYDLVVKGEPKLIEYQPGDTVTAPGGRVLTGKVLAWFDPFTLVCQDTTMAELVNSLSGPNRAGRVVIDKTGLSGAYNFTVPIPYEPLPQQYMDMSDAPSTYEGLKQLGLQMVKSMGVTDTIVVDHVERPAEN